MKIKKVKSWKENLELTRPYTIAYRTINSVENIFVQLETEDGQYGLGAGSPAPYVTNEHIEDSIKALDKHLEELLLGAEVNDLYTNLRKVQEQFATLPAAATAVDVALFDLFTKRLGVPLVNFLGKVHTSLPTSITIGIKNLEESLAEAEEYVKRDFKVIKLKTGNEVEKDIETFIKIRELVGNEVKIRVDANQGYQLGDLLRFYAATERYNLEFVEQPFHINHTKSLLGAPNYVQRKCAADESLEKPRHALDLATDPQPFGIFNIKLMKCGGVWPAQQIASIAQHAGIDLMWGCMDESIVSIAAALHAAFASRATRYIDLDGSLDLARDIVKGGFVLKEGIMYTTEEPGLGVSLL